VYSIEKKFDGIPKDIFISYLIVPIRAWEPESERPETHDLVADGAGNILFFLQEPEHFKKLEWSRNWNRSWHKLVRFQAQAVFKNFVKNNDF